MRVSASDQGSTDAAVGGLSPASAASRRERQISFLTTGAEPGASIPDALGLTDESNHGFLRSVVRLVEARAEPDADLTSEPQEVVQLALFQQSAGRAQLSILPAHSRTRGICALSYRAPRQTTRRLVPVTSTSSYSPPVTPSNTTASAVNLAAP